MARFALVAAAVLAFALTALSGFYIIPWLKALKAGQTIKEIGPTWHKNKQGTPTMGGFMFIFGSLLALITALALLGSFLPEAVFLNSQLPYLFDLGIALFSAFGFGFIGFIDDYIKVVKKRNLGLMARYKILMQIFVTTIVLAALYLNGSISTVISIPVLGSFDMTILFWPFAFLLIIGVVNAVNLTDGIDGLCASVSFTVCLGFMVIATVVGYYTIGLFATALAGACLGYLIWNFYPAKVIMGDVGAMFIGGAVVGMAAGIHKLEILLIIGIVYIIEAASVVIQVLYFKATHGKRIFKMSPIHHHFEMSGWSEVKIVRNFTLVSMVGVILSFVYYYLG